MYVANLTPLQELLLGNLAVTFTPCDHCSAKVKVVVQDGVRAHVYVFDQAGRHRTMEEGLNALAMRILADFKECTQFNVNAEQPALN